MDPINATLSTDDEQAIMTMLAAIEAKLPFLTNLTPADRQALPKLGDKSHAFLQKSLEVAMQNPGVLPASFDLKKMRNDAQLFAYLTSLQIGLRKLHKQIDDTAMLIGSQAFAAARIVYASSTSSFAGAALQTAANELGKRFGRKPKSQTSPKPQASTKPTGSTTTPPAPGTSNSPSPAPHA
jgi:hypothetical protein